METKVIEAKLVEAEAMEAKAMETDTGETTQEEPGDTTHFVIKALEPYDVGVYLGSCLEKALEIADTVESDVEFLPTAVAAFVELYKEVWPTDPLGAEGKECLLQMTLDHVEEAMQKIYEMEGAVDPLDADFAVLKIEHADDMSYRLEVVSKESVAGLESKESVSDPTTGVASSATDE